MPNKYYLAPGTVTGYKARNAKHLAKWGWRVVAVLLVMCFVSGAVRGCIASPTTDTPKQHKQVTT